MTLNQLRRLNRHIKIKGITNRAFSKYGRIVTNYDFTEMIKYMEDRTPVPEEGTLHVPIVECLEELGAFQKLRMNFYGGIPIQAGYCNGRNSKLNYLEFHKCSELIVSVTDLIIFLGRIQDIKDNQYETAKSEAFFIPGGVSVELFNTTLHSMPCSMETGGFKMLFFQFYGTGSLFKEGISEEELLHSKNRWVIAHPEAVNEVNKKIQLGIIGENVEIYLTKQNLLGDL